MVSHERFMKLGKTVFPCRIEQIKEIVGVKVDESYGSYTVWNTPNSADLAFARINDRGYVNIRGNPGWVHQFHPDEWQKIEERLDQSPFVDEFGPVRCVLGERRWKKNYEMRYEE